MRVRCIGNSGAELPSSCLDPRAGIDTDKIFPITKGTVYTVYAFTLYLGHVWYYIFDDYGDPYPVWHPGPLFDVADGEMPRGWTFAYHRPERGENYLLVSFPEWSENPSFYEKLVDGDPMVRAEFERLRQRLDIQ